MASSTLVVVNVVDLGGFARDETERYPPIAGYRNCPVASAISRQRMQAKAGKPHILRSPASIEYREYVAKSPDMLRGYPPRRFSLVKRLQPAVGIAQSGTLSPTPDLQSFA
jgi:hypothetical protein